MRNVLLCKDMTYSNIPGFFCKGGETGGPAGTEEAEGREKRLKRAKRTEGRKFIQMGVSADMGVMKFTADRDGIAEGLNYIDRELEGIDIEKDESEDSRLAAEESMIKLVYNSSPGSIMQISVAKEKSSVTIEIAVEGDKFDFQHSFDVEGKKGRLDGSDYHVAEAAVRNVVLRSYGSRIKYTHRGFNNIVTICCHRTFLDKLMGR